MYYIYYSPFLNFLGCTVDLVENDPFYSAVITNKTLIDLYVANAKSLGVEFEDVDATKLTASTDMGNISKIKPSIHPLYKIAVTGPNHTHEFTSGTGHPDNQLPTLNSAKAMAMTAIDVMCDPQLMVNVNNDFKQSTA